MQFIYEYYANCYELLCSQIYPYEKIVYPKNLLRIVEQNDERFYKSQTVFDLTVISIGSRAFDDAVLRTNPSPPH